MKRLFIIFFVLLFSSKIFAVSPNIEYSCNGHTASSPEAVCGMCVENFTSVNGRFGGKYGGSCSCILPSFPNGTICANFGASVTCPVGYKLVNPYWSVQNQEPDCVSLCKDGEYWDGTKCVARPVCNPKATFNQDSGECICSNGEPQTYHFITGEPECSGVCPKQNTDVTFNVYLGRFPNVDDSILDAARAAHKAPYYCLNNCMARTIRNLSIRAGQDDKYYAIFSGYYVGDSATCSDTPPDYEGSPGTDDPTDTETDTPPEKCRIPGTRWDESAGACVCSDGLEPGPNGCHTMPTTDTDFSDTDTESGSGGTGEGTDSGTGTGGSGDSTDTGTAGGSGGGGSGGGGSGDSTDTGTGGGSGGGGTDTGGSGGSGTGTCEGDDCGTGTSSSGGDGPADDGGCVGEDCVGTEDVPRNEDVNLVFEPDSLFPDGGACPAELSFTLIGRSVTTTAVTKMCEFVQWYVRPVAMLLGTVLALMIVNGAFRS